MMSPGSSRSSRLTHGRREGQPDGQRPPGDGDLWLHTNRLRLRPYRPDDLEALHSMWTEAGVRRFLFDDREPSREDARSFVDASMASFANHGYGLWLFFERSDDQVVVERSGDPIAGFSGLLPSSPGPPRLVFGTRPRLWRRGYATEAAGAVLHHAFDVLGLPRVVADVDEPNAGSVRVLQKLGMSRTRRAIVDGRPLVYCELTNVAYPRGLPSPPTFGIPHYDIVLPEASQGAAHALLAHFGLENPYRRKR
jgi:[ribosomal protein S5]-alanine N-acetyltransferase